MAVIIFPNLSPSPGPPFGPLRTIKKPPKRRPRTTHVPARGSCVRRTARYRRLDRAAGSESLRSLRTRPRSAQTSSWLYQTTGPLGRRYPRLKVWSTAALHARYGFNLKRAPQPTPLRHSASPFCDVVPYKTPAASAITPAIGYAPSAPPVNAYRTVS